MTLPCLVQYARRDEWLVDADSNTANWLSDAEIREWVRLRDYDRRLQWLQGRWLSKQLIQTVSQADLGDIQILTRDEQQRGVRPIIYVHSQPQAWSLSISHCAAGVIAALIPHDDLSLGVDLVGQVPTNAGFQKLWFTTEERRWLQNDPPRRSAILWGMKEAIYKACNAGEGWIPRAIQTVPNQDGSFACSYHGIPLHGLLQQITHQDEHTAVIVCVPNGVNAAEASTSIGAADQEEVVSCS